MTAILATILAGGEREEGARSGQALHRSEGEAGGLGGLVLMP